MDALAEAVTPLPLPFVLAAFESSNFVDFGLLARLEAGGLSVTA